MSDQSDGQLRARQEARAALARAQRGSVVVFSGGQRLPGDAAVVMAQAWANAGVIASIEGYVVEGDDRVVPGLPPWWPTGPAAVIAQPPSPLEVDAHLERLEVERRAAREREWDAKRGGPVSA